MLNEKQVSEAENGALMLWLSTEKKLVNRIDSGVEYFKSKYGLTPNVCIVHPDDAQLSPTETVEMAKDLLIATAPWCLRQHCLIGVVSSNDCVWGVR